MQHRLTSIAMTSNPSDNSAFISPNAATISNPSTVQPTSYSGARQIDDIAPTTIPASSTAAPNISSTTGLSGSTARDPSDTIGHRVSKRSLRRRGSATSSKRSHNAVTHMSEKTNRPIPGGNGQNAQQPRAKKKSKFLSFLCCGSPDEASETGQETSEAPRQSGVAQASPETQQPGATNPSAMTSPEQTTQPSNSALDEKAATPTYAANGSSSLGDTQREKAPVHDAPLAIDKPMPDLPTEAGYSSAPTIPTTATTFDSSSRGAGSEASRAGAESSWINTSAGGAEGSSYLAPNVIVQAPTPIAQEESEEDQFIADRTPAQQARDTDIEMTDVGPSLPLSTNDVSGTSEDESQIVAHNNESQNRVDLPPPPPLEERHAQVVHEDANASHDASLVSSQEAQKWLLPPLRSEHRGRKCLVLDLDETLVHSSFKVIHDQLCLFMSQQLTVRRSYIKQTLRFRLR